MEVHLPVEDYLNQQNKIIQNNSYFKTQNKAGGTLKVNKIEEDRLHESLIKHDYEIREIKNILGSIVETQKESSSKIAVLADGISKMDSLLEKISNVDNKYTESINRIHKRIDEKERELRAVQDLVPDYKIVEKTVKELEEGKRKIVWGILTAIGLGLLQLVMK